MSSPIVIWGAGAIGGTIGAHLVRAGHEILFVDTVEPHVRQIAERELRIEGPIAHFGVVAPAVKPDELRGQYDLILLAVKAHHTEQATAMLLPHLGREGAVVSCQNGLNELVIAALVGRERTIGAFVNFSADWLAPGQITYAGRGAVVVGELDGARTARIETLHRLLLDFEPNAVLTDNIFGYLWGKVAYGGVLAASALTNETMADFIGDPNMRPLIVGLVREVLAVATAEGVRPMGFHGFEPAAFMAGDDEAIDRSLAANLVFRRSSAKLRSGFWRDLAIRKRTTDVGAQLQPVQAAARRHRIATPISDHLVRLIGGIESGERTIGTELASELAHTARSDVAPAKA
jgi:2-dehydropantoate 2-reductase